MFYGSMVALVTPMKADGQIDQAAFTRLIEWHIEANTHALVIAGTTGEAPTLSFEEKRDLLKLAVAVAATKIPIIAGTGTHSTCSSIALTQMAMEAGVDGCLLVTPYYNKPTQEGLYQHYRAIAQAVPIPQILYNVPGRTACDMLPDTVKRLSATANIVGIKEASGKIERIQQVLSDCGSNFYVYSGDDITALEAMKIGAKGVISVTANVAPAKMAALCEAARQQNFASAEAINETLVGLHNALFCQSNPIPVKWALRQMGLIETGIRLPLTPLDDSYHAQVIGAMQQADAPM